MVRPSAAQRSRRGRRRGPAPRSEPPIAPAPTVSEPTWPAVTVPEPTVPAPTEPTPPVGPEDLDLPLATPEPAFAAEVTPPPPLPPLPSTRRAVFFDVENTSRAEHVGHMIGHLAIDRAACRTEFVAVGNWRVIGPDTARLLAHYGAQLVHSAPATGVRDWSDLRIAVSAGVWMAGARPGDMLEIVSDDRAFDAVGDVAVSLGIAFRRVSYRVMGGALAPVEAPAAPPPDRSRRGGRPGRYRRRPEPAAHPPSARPAPPPEVPEAGVGAHTAPHDEVIDLVRELASRAPSGNVLIDTVANALKTRGFRRPPGSPRLITRLRRMRELSVSPTGMIRVVGGTATDGDQPPAAAAVSSPAETATPPTDASAAQPQGQRRRRSRRGGRRRRRSAPPAAGA